MYAIKVKWLKYLTLFLIAGLLLNACKDKDEDSRIYESVVIAAVYVNGNMVSSNNLSTDPQQVTATLSPGTDLTKLKVRLTPLNGDLIDFPTDVEADYTHPVDVKVHSYNGQDVTIKLHIISKPLLVDLFIEGITVPKANIHFGETTVIAQVPVGTDLTALKVTMNFKNGELSGFTNGTAMNYTNPVPFSIIGVDGTTYPYELMITDQQVGPAAIVGVMANNAESVDIQTLTGDSVRVSYKTLTDFSNAALTIQIGFGNQLVDFVNGSVVNLWNSPKIKVKGTDGIIKIFTFLKPMLHPVEMFRKTFTEMGFVTNSGASLCFSGEYIVVSDHQGNPGLHYYDLTGTKIGTMVMPTGISMGDATRSLRKIASDDKGAIIAVNLAAGGSSTTPYNIYKWNSVTDATPAILCSFTSADFGLTATRTNGVNIQGSLDGNAVITVPISGSKAVLKWTIQNGTLVNAKPEAVSLDNTDNFVNYSSVEQYPGKPSVMVGGIAISSFAGIRSYLAGATVVSVTGSTTDLRMKTIGGRTYLACSVWGNAQHTFNFKDITDDNKDAYGYNMMWTGGNIATTDNGNATNDADMGQINGKLYVAYLGTNGGIVCYALE